jgi:hypothetical protein
MNKDIAIGFKASPELDQRLKLLQERLQERLQGMDLSRSQFIRNLLERGAEALEKELNSKEQL